MTPQERKNFESIRDNVHGEMTAQEALNKKAENARELGLDYEPEQDAYEAGYQDGKKAAQGIKEKNV